ncbi:MAG: acyltransferase [Myxococcaceae bacterium]
MSVVDQLTASAKKRLSQVRVPSTALHKVLAWEYRLRHAGVSEFLRVAYYQPLFEALCDSVGKGVQLDLSGRPRLPDLVHVRLCLGDRVKISGQSSFSGAKNAEVTAVIHVGDDSSIGSGASLCAGTWIKIGRHVLIAGDCFVSGDPGHPQDPIARISEAAPTSALGRIEIGDHVWLARGAAVLGNVRIGEGAIIGARAVVTRDVPDYAVVVGNPGKVVRRLNGKETPEELKRIRTGASAIPGSPNNVRDETQTLF